MQTAMSAKGYSTVILVLDMNRFIVPEHRERFESVRGSAAFADVLRHTWFKSVQDQKAFYPVDGPFSENGAEARMSTEEVGFVTGVFRQSMLEHYTSPCYGVRKGQIEFPELPVDNLQFKKLFMDVWQRWNFFIRPTMTGMFVVTLKRVYKKPTPLLRIASDIIGLQVSFDVPGALQWQDKIEEIYADDEETLREKQESVQKFLEWLGTSGQDDRLTLGYAPVQWQIAMEICRQFVKMLNLRIELNDHPTINMYDPKASLSTPLHDSYVVYHLDELLAPPAMLQDDQTDDDADDDDREAAPTNRHPESTQVLVTPHYIQSSSQIRRSLIQLIEGAVLRPSRGKTTSSGRQFPKHRLNYVDQVFRNDTATWIDELCLLTPRAALIVPSRHFSQHELFISTLPTSTSKVMYQWYWEALERMLEFIIEVRVLAQLVERASAKALNDFVKTSRETRESVVNEAMHVDYDVLTQLSDRAANLSRLVSVCQTLSNPQVWSRAEYAANKARHLLRQLSVPTLLTHAERNVNNMTNLLNHVDDLYIALISKRSSQLTFWLSAGLAGVSLIVILYSLPSFWADIDQLESHIITTTIRNAVLPYIMQLGNGLAPLVILISFGIILMSLWRAIAAWRKSMM